MLWRDHRYDDKFIEIMIISWKWMKSQAEIYHFYDRDGFANRGQKTYFVRFLDCWLRANQMEELPLTQAHGAHLHFWHHATVIPVSAMLFKFEVSGDMFSRMW